MILGSILFIAQFALLSELGIIPVTVVDSYNRYIPGLEAENFTLYEDKIQQPIAYFSNKPLPLSAGIILDVSGSMSKNISSARKAVQTFLLDQNPNDECFFLTFNEKLTLAQDFTTRPELINLAFLSPGGYTALFDAVYFGIDKLQEATNSRRALIIVTDGEDNRSRYTLTDIKNLAVESDVQVYVIQQRNEYGHSILSTLAAATGGKVFQPYSLSQLNYYVDVINLELRNQYILGYVPSDATQHKITVTSESGRLVYRKRIGGKK